MDDALRVRGGAEVEDALADVKRGLDRNAAAAAPEILQGLAYEQLHEEERLVHLVPDVGNDEADGAVAARDGIVAVSQDGERAFYVALKRPTLLMVPADPVPAGAGWRESLTLPVTG